MSINARYAHTNIVARDWRALADFYIGVFGCELVGPERDHYGPWIEDVTGVAGAHVKGAHLRLPGFEDGHGPTLEIFQYNEGPDDPPATINHLGFAHIAFVVDDVEQARQLMLEHGGRDIGRVVTSPPIPAGTITLVYMTDPEGNIVELQKWA